MTVKFYDELDCLAMTLTFAQWVEWVEKFGIEYVCEELAGWRVEFVK